MAEIESTFLKCLRKRVLVFDGAMGTSLQALGLPPEDYRGLENCSEILTQTRPDAIEQVHASFLAVGCDAIETNTFGANRVVLSEYGLADQVYELNRRAAEIARGAAKKFSTAEHPRFVAGSVGPGTRLASLRQISYDELHTAYIEQIHGLLDGGVDVLVIETCQDILQIKAAIQAARAACTAAGQQVPLMCQVTVEPSGTMLLGTDIAAALTTLLAFPEVRIIGLNCATGPMEMAEHVRFLAANCPRPISVLPNAGIPQLVDGQARFPLEPAELARWLGEFVEVEGVNIVGGCCGTTPEHLQAVTGLLGNRPPITREGYYEPSISSLYQAVSLRQERSVLLVGERCNANGSRKFRGLLQAGDIEGLVQTAVEQVNEGAHVLDVCVDTVGRDGAADMSLVVDRLAREVTVPLMLDSTEPDVIETGLKLAGGKCIINSVNLEGGEEKLARICRLLRQYGAAVVALTIDDDPDEAMAKTADRKLAVARRLHELLTRKYELPESDIFFDCLTFPITTGNEEDRGLARETLEAIAAVRKAFPLCQTILGISNVSFGLQPVARVVLNSVFLAEAQAHGLTAAIVHASKILPRNRIRNECWEAARDLIYDRREDGDPLERFIALFAENEEIARRIEAPSLSVGQRLRQRIIDGQRDGLETDLDEALQEHAPLDLVNGFLLEGMQEVGELFGSGKMQLPFVLKSAETIKAAVAHLAPHMKYGQEVQRGSIVLATVRGDVHDIGKNLVDIILSNNGYKVYNLGIRQPIAHVIEMYELHEADAIGLSGLLVRSTQVMRDDLHVLNASGIRVPVILGGAALTRRYVEEELRPVYAGPLYYAHDAFDGLRLMQQITTSRVPPAPEPVAGVRGPVSVTPVVHRDRRYSNIVYTHSVPPPPFWGARVIEHIPLPTLLAYMNENMLYQVQWHFHQGRRSPADYREYVEREVRPIYHDLLARCERERILAPQAIYGYWPCNSAGDEIVIHEPPAEPDAPADAHGAELCRLRFPRQAKRPWWCLSDFWRPADDQTDVIACALVTVGARASEVAAQWFHEAHFQEYLYLHGLSVELAEALAEYMHRRIREELGISEHDAHDMRKIFQQGYQGSRYSFGYPACPNLEDQAYLMALLEAGRIGVSISEEYQLIPEQSISALIAYHPQARYFSAR
ncbi:MAG: methionine synthase [Planctomycetota bacterium]